LDHIVVFGEAHLHRILRSYARYYNEVRTHRSLDKDAPVSLPGSADREHEIVPYPRRTPSPLHPGLSFRYTHPPFELPPENGIPPSRKACPPPMTRHRQHCDASLRVAFAEQSLSFCQASAICLLWKRRANWRPLS
jgi:hypothetical protein